MMLKQLDIYMQKEEIQSVPHTIQKIIQILMHQNLLSKTVLSIKNIRSYVSENLNIELTFLPWKNKF